MKVSVKPGKYVVAVSGGLDSMVLLDVMSNLPDVDLTVAHFDHGIRPDSRRDEQLVAAAARRYGLPFVSARGNLGPAASEATARTARYNFLQRVMDEQRAGAIITAHHQDDRIETAIINLIRGTGRKGLDALRSTPRLVRPLLHLTKQDLHEYARQQTLLGRSIAWREDSTNASDAYLRNYIRHHIMHVLTPAQRQTFLSHLARAGELNAEIDTLLLAETGNRQRSALNRHRFIMLPYDVSCEVMAAWLRRNGLRQFDRKAIGRLVVAAKVSAAGKQVNINTGHWLKVGRRELHIKGGTIS